jgi:hypothetical protein
MATFYFSKIESSKDRIGMSTCFVVWHNFYGFRVKFVAIKVVALGIQEISGFLGKEDHITL